MSKTEILVQGMSITLARIDQSDYISLTDIARIKNPDEPKDVVKNWMRSRTTIEYIGLWERINNPNFKGVEFDTFKAEAGLNSYKISVKEWVIKTNDDSDRTLGCRLQFLRSDGSYGAFMKRQITAN